MKLTVLNCRNQAISLIESFERKRDFATSILLRIGAKMLGLLPGRPGVAKGAP
jgi:hypothetical protein